MLTLFQRFVIVTALLFCPMLVAQQPPKKSAEPTLRRISPGSLTENIYRNADLNFSYKLPYGWVDRTQQSQAEPDKSTSGQVLLAVFEHPPEVKGDSVNSAVIVAAESLSSYPGVETAIDYFDPLTEAVTSQGFKVVNEPYAITLGAKPLVRSDFSKEIGKLTMYQCSLVMLSKGYAVSFTFIGGSEDEVEQLMERLSFALASAKH